MYTFHVQTRKGKQRNVKPSDKQQQFVDEDYGSPLSAFQLVNKAPAIILFNARELESSL